MKEELGIDHFENHSWTGLHRHTLMSCIACAWLEPTERIGGKV